MPIRSISVPCMVRDLDAFDQMLSWWEDPRVFPRHSDNKDNSEEPVALLVVLNRASDEEMELFKSVWKKHRFLHAVFSEFYVFQAGLTGDRDLYARGADIARGVFGNKAGPNFLFFETMKFANAFGGHTFQNEIDCYPTKSGWLTDLNEIVRLREFAWVIGSIYTGEYPVGRSIQLHLNGNAIYKAGDNNFINFIDTIWGPRLQEFIPLDPNLAYDCWWATEVARASSSLRNKSWQLVSRFEQYFCTCQFVLNTLHSETVLADIEIAVASSKDSGISPIFIHGHSATNIFTSFISSSDIDLFDFAYKSRISELILLKESESQVLNSTLLDLNLDDYSESAVLEMLTANGSAKKVDPPNIVGVLEVKSLPAKIRVNELDESVLLGNWHQRGDADHVWAGPGASAISLNIVPIGNAIKLEISGGYPNVQPQPIVKVQVYGARNITVEEQQRGFFMVTAFDDIPINSLSIIMDISGAGKVGQDSRELGFALFSIAIYSLNLDETG